MKKTLAVSFGILLSLILSGSVIAQQTTPPGSKQKEKEPTDLSWNKTKHVFGSIEHKNPVTANFVFTNNGDKAIAVTKVGVTCNCTAPGFPKEPIKPGEKGTITVRFDAMAPGFFKKPAKVFFTDGTAKLLEIEGKVQVRMRDMKVKK